MNELLDTFEQSFLLFGDMYSKLDSDTAVRNALCAFRHTAEGEAALTKNIDTYLGGKNSPNLIRLPVAANGLLDVDAMVNTILDPTVEFLTHSGQRVPAPMFHGAYKVLRCYVNIKDKTTQEVKKVFIGYYLDVEPYVVALHSLMLGKGSHRNVAQKMAITFERTWDKDVTHHHTGWARIAVLHVRVDLPVNHVVVDQTSAEIIADYKGLTLAEVSGMPVDMTGWPVVNADCSPDAILRVLSEPGTQQHMAASPEMVKPMGRDNDGDAPALHQMKGKQTAANNPLLAMLQRNKEAAKQ